MLLCSLHPLALQPAVAGRRGKCSMPCAATRCLAVQNASLQGAAFRCFSIPQQRYRAGSRRLLGNARCPAVPCGALLGLALRFRALHGSSSSPTALPRRVATPMGECSMRCDVLKRRFAAMRCYAPQFPIASSLGVATEVGKCSMPCNAMQFIAAKCIAVLCFAVPAALPHGLATVAGK